MTKSFNVIIEKDEDGYFVATVPSLRGCHTQAKSLDKLMERAKEAIELCLDVEEDVSENEFIGIQHRKRSYVPNHQRLRNLQRRTSNATISELKDRPNR